MLSRVCPWLHNKLALLKSKSLVKDERFWNKVLSDMLLSLADVQLLFSAAFIIAAPFQCTISVYHVSIIQQLSSIGVLSSIAALSECREELIEKPVTRWIRLAVLAALNASLVLITFIQGTEGWCWLWECLYCRSARGPIKSLPFKFDYCVLCHPLYKSFLLVLNWLSTVITLTPGWTEPALHYCAAYFSWLDRRQSSALSLLEFISRESPNKQTGLKPVIQLAINIIKAIITLPLSALLCCLVIVFNLLGLRAGFPIDFVGFSSVWSIMRLVRRINAIYETRRRGHALMQASEAQMENEWSFGRIVPASMLIATLTIMIDTLYSRFSF